MSRPYAATVLYDGDCGVCRFMLSGLLAWDRAARLRPVALQTPEAERLLAGMPEELRLASWHLVFPDGRVYSAGDAVPQLARLLPRGAPVAALAAALQPLVNRGYEITARNRGRIGRLVPARAKERASRAIERRERLFAA